MSVIKLYSDNPDNGIDSFDKIRFYEATDNDGTGATLIATVAINIANVNPIDPGFTSTPYTSGSTTKYYASTWYNSITGAETDKSDWILGGTDRWDTMFRLLMKDTAKTVWADADLAEFKRNAIEALYPEFFYESIDTSLTVVNNSTTKTKSYSLPLGIFNISEVGVGNPNDEDNYPFGIVVASNWNIEQNKLVFGSLSDLTDGYPIRLICSRKYYDVGQVPARLDSLIMLHLRKSAYMQMVDDYPRFLNWSRLQKGTRVTFEGLKLLVNQYDNMFQKEKDRIKDMERSTRL